MASYWAWLLSLRLTWAWCVKRTLYSSVKQSRICIPPGYLYQFGTQSCLAAPWDDCFAVGMQNQDSNIVFVMLLRTLKQGHSWFLETCRLCLYCTFRHWVREWAKNLVCCLIHPALDVGCLQCNRVSLSSGYLQILPALCAWYQEGSCLQNTKWDRKKVKLPFGPYTAACPQAHLTSISIAWIWRRMIFICIHKHM